MTYPRTVGEARKRVEHLDHCRRSLFDDPMTSAMGAPTEDFCEAWDREERWLLAYILRNSPKDSKRWTWALNRMEAYMP